VPNALTELALKAAKPPVSGTRTIWDGAVRGFGCRISPKGLKSFIVLVSSGRRRTIGRYPVLSIGDARAEAKRILADITLGRDVSSTILVAEAVALFLADVKQRTSPRTFRDYTRLLNRHLPKIARKQLGKVDTKDIAGIIDRLADTPAEAAHALVAIRVFFNWCVRRTWRTDNPTGKLVARKLPRRERILSDDQLRIVWQTAERFPYPFGAIVRLCILLGQRRSEIGLLEWTWINFEECIITFPAGVTKNKREHRLPIGNMAIQLLSSLPRSHSQYVFPAAREHKKGVSVRTVNGWSNSKRAFDKLLPNVPHWVLHDLRRTFRTNLARLGVAPHVAERVVNHISAQSEVERIYDVWSYLPEMRVAMDGYETWLSSVVL
jgi:integrase